MKFALTHPFACSYLPHQYEQLIVLAGYADITPNEYEALLNAGFRRSGDHVYRPHCPQCAACQSLRIPVQAFRANRNQRRVAKAGQAVKHHLADTDHQEYYALYARYISARHQDGSMYPPSQEQYQQFIRAPWGSPMFLELRLEGELIAVAVTDVTNHALSALYTFFSPELAKLSLGTLAILRQIELARELGKQYLYLGYQIDQCEKMRYKASFTPNEKYIQGVWY